MAEDCPSGKLHVVERYIRTALSTMRYEANIEGSQVLVRRHPAQFLKGLTP